MAMKMAPVLMKMAPGVIPRPGSVSERRLLSPETEFRMATEHGGVFAIMTIPPRVYASGALSSPKGSVGGQPRRPHHRRARAHLGPRPSVVWGPGGSSPGALQTVISPIHFILFLCIF